MKNVFFTILFFAFIGAYAQETINASGGKASGSDGSVCYSVGQIVYQTSSGTDGSVDEGVQQPYEITQVTAIEKTQDINLMLSAFPNPTTDHLTLEVDVDSYSTLYYQLYDMRGNLLQSSRIHSFRTSIKMGAYLPSTYLLKITKNGKPIKTFKISKRS